jgi:hypothetical protein
MPLTVLSDSNVKKLLHSLTKSDVEALQKSLRHALHEYSTGTQDDAACSSQQPERTSHMSPNGLTMLFMPSTSSSGLGMKGTYPLSPNFAEYPRVVTDKDSHSCYLSCTV